MRLTPQQKEVLAFLGRCEHASTQAIGNRLYFNSGLTFRQRWAPADRIVTALYKKGLVRPDHTGSWVLTDAGKAVAA